MRSCLVIQLRFLASILWFLPGTLSCPKDALGALDVTRVKDKRESILRELRETPIAIAAGGLVLQN